MKGGETMDEVQAAINVHIEADAREFGLHDRQGQWRLGLLVARNVQVGKGHGGRYAEADPDKISAGEFAHLAGTTKKRVMKYYRAWLEAAKQGYVPHPLDLEVGQELETLLADRLPDWSDFYEAEVRPEVGVEVVKPRQRTGGGEPASETMAWNSAACSIPNAVDRIAGVEGSIGALLAGQVYRLNKTDLLKLKTVLIEALERIEHYEPIKAKTSHTDTELAGRTEAQ